MENFVVVTAVDLVQGRRNFPFSILDFAFVIFRALATLRVVRRASQLLAIKSQALSSRFIFVIVLTSSE